MRFQPLNTLKKDSYVSPKWTPKRLEMIARARRVIGYGGAFPPYEGLIKKLREAQEFDEAFNLYPEDRAKKANSASRVPLHALNITHIDPFEV